MTMGAVKAISPFNWYLFLSVFISYVYKSSPLLSCILTPIIDSQPKSCLAFVNTRKYLSSVVSVSKRTRNGKHDESRKPLVGHSDSKEHEQEERKHKTMESKETSRLFYGKSIYEAIQNTGSKERQKDSESVNDEFRYYTVDPSWMNVRLCIFWFLWAILIVVFVISILSYCCFLWQTCNKSEKLFILNATNT
ncbi:LOW QUALITY PROTEIN: uncharacterized protein LOC143349880 [Colletes latitarsis]|uniref:LOW QUALITY PROTEIN: uncharacterized protein LOC143349880 n=1 Tax=Colletes latitarsis TaxID=2605962 RepID=UPI004035DC38